MTYPSVISQEGSASRNLVPIIDALTPLLSSTTRSPISDHVTPPVASELSRQRNQGRRRILELGSYPYDHIVAFARRWDDIEWLGCVRDHWESSQVEERLKNIDTGENLLGPRKLDISMEEDWNRLQKDVGLASGEAFEGVIMLNLVHCVPAHLPEEVFRHLSPLISPGRRLLDGSKGWIAAYGPWLDDEGNHKSVADQEFDEKYIKAHHPDLGLRSVKSITHYAEKWGFVEEGRSEMPKGNTFVVWRVKPR
ncbi:hypothetical protein IAR55_002206 [Kwoniella newhampshirensis]|uniref:Methyltransferase type 11 domain-containing protein n=1 Tax=Kwoniella newhampshirensis TaxID=1651941 RepID=A0AAW0YTU3_9TREE